MNVLLIVRTIRTMKPSSQDQQFAELLIVEKIIPYFANGPCEKLRF